MHRILKTIRNFILIGLLLAVFMAFTGMRPTPNQAHEYSDKVRHFGPSEILSVYKYDGYQDMLCKYDNWITCDTIRGRLIFWQNSNNSAFEIDKSESLNFSGRLTSDGVNIVYGIVNDPNIAKVKLKVPGMEPMIQEEFQDDLFYFTWESVLDLTEIEGITGYNQEGEQTCKYTLF